MEKSVDLHVHTTCSDGKLSPKQVVDEAVKNNVSVLAIADHDSVDAYNDELFLYAQNKGIKIIPAVEISTKHKGVGVHVLGYGFNLDNKQLLETLSSLKNARRDYLFNVSKKLSELGYIVDEESLSQLASVTKAHIAENVILNTANKNLLKSEFEHIPNKGEFIESVMNNGCPCYVEKFCISPCEASKIIHEAGGVVVLAHPVAYKYEDGVDADWIKQLVDDMNADGIESNYLYIDKKGREIDEIDFWTKFAKDNGLFSTTGSDFHFSDGIHPEIGFVNKLFVFDRI